MHLYPCPFLCFSFTCCSPWPEPGREPLGFWMKWLSWAGLPLSQGSHQGISSRKGQQQLCLPPVYTSHPIIQLVLSCMGCTYIEIWRDSWGGRKEEVKVFHSMGAWESAYPGEAGILIFRFYEKERAIVTIDTRFLCSRLHGGLNWCSALEVSHLALQRWTMKLSGDWRLFNGQCSS